MALPNIPDSLIYQDQGAARDYLHRENGSHRICGDVTEEMVLMLPYIGQAFVEYDVARIIELCVERGFTGDYAPIYYHEYESEAAKVCLCLDLWASPAQLKRLLQTVFQGDHDNGDAGRTIRDEISRALPPCPNYGRHFAAMAQEIWTKYCVLRGVEPPEFQRIELPPLWRERLNKAAGAARQAVCPTSPGAQGENLDWPLMTEAELHVLGIETILPSLKLEGVHVEQVNREPGTNPQVVGRLFGRPAFILVRTSTHPDKGKLSEEEIAANIALAEKNGGTPFFASVRVACLAYPDMSPTANDKDLARPIRNGKFVTNYSGLRRMTREENR